MTNILSWKQFKKFAASATARLSLSYLAIIMLMSIGFSVVFYNTSARALRPHGMRPSTVQQTPFGNNDGSPPHDDRPRIERDPAVEAYLKQREAEGKDALLQRLIILNLVALAAGSALSYYLARRTLEPIEENMEAQAQFVSDASHELRTPLTALQTTNEVALRKPRLSKAEARDLLEHNVSEVTKLQGLTAALLNLAKTDGSDTRHVPVSIQAASAEAINTVIPAAQNKNISIEDHVPKVMVLGDATALAQSIAILLDNAIKYSPIGSTITISGGTSGRHGEIIVKDHGNGIAAKDLPHIFDRFYRADQSRTRGGGQQADGYGIGLSLAKKLVHQMNGEVYASSSVGNGSRFTIRLQLA